jgi:hypothetical protein
MDYNKQLIDVTALDAVGGGISEEYGDYYIVKIPRKNHQQFLIKNRAEIVNHKYSGDKVVYTLKYLRDER